MLSINQMRSSLDPVYYFRHTGLESRFKVSLGNLVRSCLKVGIKFSGRAQHFRRGKVWSRDTGSHGRALDHPEMGAVRYRCV